MNEWNLIEVQKRALKMPTTVVSDAMDACGLRNNTVSGIRPTWNCSAIVGTALTVRNIPAGSRTQVVHGGFKTSDLVEPGNVVVIGNDGDVENNGWGGIVSWASKLRGAVGTIVDGAARNILYLPKALCVERLGDAWCRRALTNQFVSVIHRCILVI